MAKLVLSDLASLQNETTAIAVVNDNNDSLETALENTLSRDGTSPNAMGANLDLNNFRIINLPSPVASGEPLRLGDLTSIGTITGVIAPVTAPTDSAIVLWNGTSGVLIKNSVVIVDSSGNISGIGTLAASGAVTLSSTLAVTGNVTVNTNKFVVTASNGNTTVGGTFGVTGVSTLASVIVTGAATVGTTLGVTGATTLSSTAHIVGAVTLDSTLNVTGTTTLGVANVTTETVTTVTPTTIAGNANFTGTPTFAANQSTTGSITATKQIRSITSTALATTGTVSLDPTLSQLFTITPTGTNTINATSAAVGTEVVLVMTTSGGSSFVTTFGTNFKSTGTLTSGTVTGKVFTIRFYGDGTNLNEVSRTTAM